MRTPAQLEASRANGARSRGPRTPEGKAASSQNATRHGFYARALRLLPGEEPERLEENRQLLEEHFAAASDDPLRRILARRLAEVLWRQERIDRLEADHLARIAQDQANARDYFPAGRILPEALPVLNPVSRARSVALREMKDLLTLLKEQQPATGEAFPVAPISLAEPLPPNPPWEVERERALREQRLEVDYVEGGYRAMQEEGLDPRRILKSRSFQQSYRHFRQQANAHGYEPPPPMTGKKPPPSPEQLAEFEAMFRPPQEREAAPPEATISAAEPMPAPPAATPAPPILKIPARPNEPTDSPRLVGAMPTDSTPCPTSTPPAQAGRTQPMPAPPGTAPSPSTADRSATSQQASPAAPPRPSQPEKPSPPILEVMARPTGAGSLRPQPAPSTAPARPPTPVPPPASPPPVQRLPPPERPQPPVLRVRPQSEVPPPYVPVPPRLQPVLPAASRPASLTPTRTLASPAPPPEPTALNSAITRAEALPPAAPLPSSRPQ